MCPGHTPPIGCPCQRLSVVINWGRSVPGKGVKLFCWPPLAPGLPHGLTKAFVDCTADSEASIYPSLNPSSHIRLTTLAAFPSSFPIAFYTSHKVRACLILPWRLLLRDPGLTQYPFGKFYGKGQKWKHQPNFLISGLSNIWFLCTKLDFEILNLRSGSLLVWLVSACVEKGMCLVRPFGSLMLHGHREWPKLADHLVRPVLRVFWARVIWIKANPTPLLENTFVN